ncbi:hypothetical protein [Stenotrophomonas maltophilia]|uniref:hypothetical protein n=1 Tax=Stenotrophomonas maltophilia TaxID=40324 RepID=UPI0020163182|nr:hypothetical protein [Stenotrophomonas maltophilia]
MNRTSSSPHLRDGIPQDADALIALDSVAATDPRRIMQIADWLAHGVVNDISPHVGSMVGPVRHNALPDCSIGARHRSPAGSANWSGEGGWA